MTRTWIKYILWFAQEHVDFRQAEFNAITKLFELPFRILSENLLKPFWIVEFPNNEAACKFASRSVALRCVLELWSHGTSLPNFHNTLKDYIRQDTKVLETYLKGNQSFKINVETYNKHFTQAQKIQKIETLDYLDIQGEVDLKCPQLEYWYIEFWGLDPKNVPADAEDVLFGRWFFIEIKLANGQRHLIKELSLKQRKFIGNTSMDAQLSLLMANQALVKEGDLIFDPFVGTGSLLVSAAKFGGYVLGSDIDYMMLHARNRPSRITQRVRERDESIRANLRQYGCEKYYLDVVVSDFSNSVWRGVQFDGIVTDPPYGIREATERVETKAPAKSNTRTEDMPHYPSTSHYALQNLYGDLLVFAAKHLKIGGRLVCWLPFHREDYTDNMVPKHVCLTLVANSEQPLTGLTSRRLLTYEKHAEPDISTALEQLLTITQQPAEFRQRYFDSEIESRNERRMRKAAQRENGRLEAIKRGKITQDSRELKNNLNKARFD